MLLKTCFWRPVQSFGHVPHCDSENIQYMLDALLRNAHLWLPCIVNALNANGSVMNLHGLWLIALFCRRVWGQVHHPYRAGLILLKSVCVRTRESYNICIYTWLANLGATAYMARIMNKAAGVNYQKFRSASNLSNQQQKSKMPRRLFWKEKVTTLFDRGESRKWYS